MSDHVRVRFAPSPTGWLHIGGLRTALYNYLFAKKHGGTFVLRIEDTDQARYVDGAEDDIINSMKWSGLEIDEGPGFGGESGPYRQSERSELYRNYAEQLVNAGHAYYAFDTAKEIEQMREQNPNQKYDAVTRMSMKNSVSLPADEVKKRLDAGEDHVIRLKVPDQEKISFEDKIRGFVSFESEGLDDQVLMKSDGLPTYHLANVVDDHLMGITHVIRGEEWLSSAPKHLLLYKYLGWNPPAMAHLPLIMSPSGGKLSKRNAEKLGIPVNVRDYISEGWEPEALINFLAYLGWSPGDDREIMSLDELAKEFSLERVGKAGAVFNIDKLTWYNEHYMRDRSPEDLLQEVKKHAAEAGISGFEDDRFLGMIRLMQERVSKVPEFATEGAYFFNAPDEYDEKSTKKAWKTETPDLVKKYMQAIKKLDDSSFQASRLKDILKEVIDAEGVGFGKLMLPVRIAITGTGQGPDLFEIMQLLGREECESRLQTAISKLG